MKPQASKSRVFYPMTPPKMPSDLQDVDQATMLLGHMAKGPVKQKVLREIERLLGELPHPDVVVAWKTALKQHRKDISSQPQAKTHMSDNASAR